MAVTSNGNKEELRQKALKLRNSFSQKTIDNLSVKITNELTKNFDFRNKNIHLFLPIERNNEVNTWHLYHLISSYSKISTSFYEKSEKKWKCISFKNKTEFTTTAFNVPIPCEFEYSNWEEIDFIIVPLIVFDIKGHRIGYGKGIYDQILDSIDSKCIKIGVSVLKISDMQIDSESHDITLNYCQTPSELYHFNKVV